jgi:hypothetical protein
LRAELEAEQMAAQAAVDRAEARTTETGQVSDELLNRMRELRAAVLNGIGSAPDRNSLRRLLPGTFESVIYWPAEKWGDALVIPGSSGGCNVGPRRATASTLVCISGFRLCRPSVHRHVARVGLDKTVAE